MNPGQYLTQLEHQVHTGYPIRLYCPVCYWGKTGEASPYCPYGHGEMHHIIEFLEELTAGV